MAAVRARHRVQRAGPRRRPPPDGACCRNGSPRQLVWADGGYAGRLVAWAAALLAVTAVVKRSETCAGSSCFPAAGSSNAARLVTGTAAGPRLREAPRHHEAMLLWATTSDHDAAARPPADRSSHPSRAGAPNETKPQSSGERPRSSMKHHSRTGSYQRWVCACRRRRP